MRVVLRYEDGRPIWSENEPATASIAGIRGSLVSGEHGVVERGRRHSNATARIVRERRRAEPKPMGRPRLSPDVELHNRGQAYATEEERIAARRQSWRESARRKREGTAA